MGNRNSGEPRGNGSSGPGDALAARLPRTGLAGWLDAYAGPGDRYVLLSDADVVAAAGRWDALESWCAARKLGALREVIRRSPASGDAPEAADSLAPLGPWRFTLDSEVGLELAVTRNAADGLLDLAVALETRLPLTARALEQGVLSLSKVRMIADVTSVLSDEDARRAEEMIAGKWQGKTWGQLHRLISLAVMSVDPEGARKRREKAEREDARVRFWVENAGTAGIAATGVPADDALRAMTAVQDRALAYQKAGLGDPMHLLRVRAFIDLITGQDARASRTASSPGDGPRGGGPDQDLAGYYASDQPDADAGLIPDDGLHLDDPDPDGYDPDLDGPAGPDGTDPDGNGPDGNGSGGNDGGNDGGSGPGANGGNGGERLAANVELTLPLATLLGLAEVPGEARDLGTVDPAMARRLAASAARHPDSTFTLIITDAQGRAVAFGVAHPRRGKRARRGKPTRPSATARAPSPPQAGTPGNRERPPGTSDQEQDHSGAGQPLARTSPDARIRPAARQPAGCPAGQPAGPDSRWDLDIDGRAMTVTLVPIPRDGEGCDHRWYTPSYRPGVTLQRIEFYIFSITHSEQLLVAVRRAGTRRAGQQRFAGGDTVRRMSAGSTGERSRCRRRCGRPRSPGGRTILAATPRIAGARGACGRGPSASGSRSRARMEYPPPGAHGGASHRTGRPSSSRNSQVSNTA